MIEKIELLQAQLIDEIKYSKGLEDRLSELEQKSLIKFTERYALNKIETDKRIKEVEQNYKTHRDCITGFQIQLGNIEAVLRRFMDLIFNYIYGTVISPSLMKPEFEEVIKQLGSEEKEPSESPAEDMSESKKRHIAGIIKELASPCDLDMGLETCVALEDQKEELIAEIIEKLRNLKTLIGSNVKENEVLIDMIIQFYKEKLEEERKNQ